MYIRACVGFQDSNISLPELEQNYDIALFLGLPRTSEETLALLTHVGKAWERG